MCPPPFEEVLRRLAECADAPTRLRNTAVAVVGEDHDVEATRQRYVLEEALNRRDRQLASAKHSACSLYRKRCWINAGDVTPPLSQRDDIAAAPGPDDQHCVSGLDEAIDQVLLSGEEAFFDFMLVEVEVLPVVPYPLLDVLDAECGGGAVVTLR